MNNTLQSKPHYPILDGLRGVAAILVVIFHLFEALYPVPANHPMHHGYLAVDFFFLLSGFVIGYAYDDRWNNMSIKEFFTIRLIRLHPMVVLSLIIGVICFYLDPYTNGMANTTVLKLIGVFVLSITLLPAPDIRGWAETHPLNGPHWSLLQEYVANILYALFVRKMGKLALWILVIIAGVALTLTAAWHGDVATGWSFETIWIAFIRMLFPFFAGLLLFRSNKIVQLPFAFPIASILLMILFFLPTLTYNGIYEAVCIIFAFPIIVAIGAGGKITGVWARICKFSGEISYPIYIIHYPFIYIYTMWVVKNKPTAEEILPVAIGLFCLFILIAYASLKLYDAPVRAWLKKKILTK